MSELDSFYLGSIGLLGEYHPTSMKEHAYRVEKAGGNHLQKLWNFVFIEGCECMQPAFLEATSEADLPASFAAIPSSIITSLS